MVAEGNLSSARRGGASRGVIWCNLGDLKGENCISFYQLDLLSFSISCPKIPFIHKLFQVCQDKIAKYLRFVFLLN